MIGILADQQLTRLLIENIGSPTVFALSASCDRTYALLSPVVAGGCPDGEPRVG